MFQVWIIVLGIFSVQAFGNEFSHIKITPQFEQYLNRPKLKSLGPQPMSMQSESSSSIQEEFTHKIRTQLLGANDGAGDFNTPFPTDGESLLYEQIRGHLEAAHREIGLREVAQLDFLNQQFNLGSSNFSGFSWQKPYGVVHVHADRQVVPNLFGNNWLVQDTFTFDIEATSFLERSNEAGITSMSDAEIGAFAGITFRRIYTYYHYANSYQDGLRADFTKLFLPFLKLNLNQIPRMSPEEIIKREDQWTVSAGGLVSTPPGPPLSFSAGVLAQFAYHHQVSVQHNPVVAETDEKFRLKIIGKKTASAGVNLSLQLDFFRLLRLTVMNYDLAYEYSSAKEFTLGLTTRDWSQVNMGIVESSELRTILQGFGEVRSLERYLIGLEENQSSAHSQRGNLLVWGRMQKSKTEQIRVVKDQNVRVFFKSYAQNMRVVQNIFSRLFSAVIYKLFKLPMTAKNAALYNRQVQLEYEATHPQAANPEIARIDGTEQFSFVLKQSYEAARTDRWVDRKFKNDLIWFADSFTTLPKDYLAQISEKKLKGPMLIESNLRVEKAGFDYLLQTPEAAVFDQINRVCRSNTTCVTGLREKFLAFKKDYQEHALKPSLARFKAFLTKYYKEAQSLQDLTQLFGAENTFIHGQIKATTPQNAQFVTTFSTGQFRGLGVIDNFKRANGTRSPASIVSE